jgi:hypothetical protein
MDDEQKVDPMYGRFGLVLAINAVIMFLITYVNIAELGHYHFNLNRVYMALLMVAPMAILMLLVMRSMYPNTKLNILLLGGFAALGVLMFVLIRVQAPIGNEQFIRSMTPHHSSAILMCEQSDITDPELAALCDEIVEAQKEEIAEMARILERLDG